MSEIYRGYDIDGNARDGYVIRKDGEVIGSQPSLEFAYKFIDREKRKADDAAEADRRCTCFADSGLTASTHTTADGRVCCDLCGWPIQDGAVDVLTAINRGDPR